MLQYLPSALLSQTWILDFRSKRVLQLYRTWWEDLWWPEVRLAPGQTGKSDRQRMMIFSVLDDSISYHFNKLISAFQVWMYCRLYRTMERFHKPEILEAAKAGMLFMELSGKSWGVLEFTGNVSLDLNKWTNICSNMSVGANPLTVGMHQGKCYNPHSKVLFSSQTRFILS